MAEIKISQLPPVVTALDTDEFEVNQGGVSKKVTRTQILSESFTQKAGAFFATDQVRSRSVSGLKLFGIDDKGIFVNSAGDVGIGTTTPNSKLQVAGAVSTPISTKTADYTITASDSGIVGNPASNNITFILPTAVGISGREYKIKNRSATHSIVIDGAGTETIDDTLTKTLASQYAGVVVKSTGTNWIIVSQMGKIS